MQRERERERVRERYRQTDRHTEIERDQNDRGIERQLDWGKYLIRWRR